MTYIIGICACVFLVIFGLIMIFKISKYYDGLIEDNYKKYTDHIDDWYYEILEVKE